MPWIWLVSLVMLALATPDASAQSRMEVRDGEKGYIHIVVRGDTLWDISNAYLGTPWIWPSVWGENEYIANPHLIYPKNEIWISESLLRKLTPEEAERLRRAMAQRGTAYGTAADLELLSGEDEPGRDGSRSGRDGSRTRQDGSRWGAGSEWSDANANGAGPLLEVPAAPTDNEDEEESPPSGDDPFAALDQGKTGVQHVVEFSGLHRYGFVTDMEYMGTGAILGSHDQNYWASQGQRTIVSLGEAKAHMGDDLTVFRTIKRVVHPETLEVLGYFVEILGRAEITEIHPQSSFVRVVASYAEIEPGDRVMPYVEQPSEFVEVHSSDSLEGRVLAYQQYRLQAADGDMILLDRGTREGMVPGRRFELFRAARDVRDPVTLEEVLVPDDIVGGAFVVKVSEKTALALVTRSRTDIRIGDRFRSAK